jgi:hypothetical protein
MRLNYNIYQLPSKNKAKMHEFSKFLKCPTCSDSYVVINAKRHRISQANAGIMAVYDNHIEEVRYYISLYELVCV